MADLALPVRGIDPIYRSAIDHINLKKHTLQLWLSGDGITIDLITSSDHTMQWFLVVSKYHVLPQGIITGFVLPLELVRVNT
jgi:hypothetical protein